MIKLIRAWWTRRLRRTDFQILAPLIKEKADTPQEATVAAMTHVSFDYAWNSARAEEVVEFVTSCGGSVEYISLRDDS